MQYMHFMHALSWPGTQGAGVKKCEMSAVGSVLFKSSSSGSSTSLMLMMRASGGMRGPGTIDDFTLLGVGSTGSEVTSDVVEETTILSQESECFDELWLWEKALLVPSLVSVGGGGEDAGKGDDDLDVWQARGSFSATEVGGSFSAAEAQAMALWWEVSSRSPALSAVSLAIGKIFCAGQKHIGRHRLQVGP